MEIAVELFQLLLEPLLLFGEIDDPGEGQQHLGILDLHPHGAVGHGPGLVDRTEVSEALEMRPESLETASRFGRWRQGQQRQRLAGGDLQLVADRADPRDQRDGEIDVGATLPANANGVEVRQLRGRQGDAAPETVP